MSAAAPVEVEPEIVPDESTKQRFCSMFQAAALPIEWKRIEPVEGQYEWEIVDRLLECLASIQQCAILRGKAAEDFGGPGPEGARIDAGGRSLDTDAFAKDLENPPDIKGAKPEEVAIVGAAVEKAQSMLATLQQQLQEIELKSPIDGVVTVLGVTEGELVQPGQPVNHETANPIASPASSATTARASTKPDG